MKKIINIFDTKNSDIKYDIIKYPDSQQDIKININSLKGFIDDNVWVDKEIDEVEIKSNFTSFKDLELIICVSKALYNLGVYKQHLYIPYLFGSRSDRQFIEGSTSYLVDVIAPIINSLNFKTVTTIDVHSNIAAACIKNLKNISNIELVRWSLDDIYGFTLGRTKGLTDNKFILLSPDTGSLNKIYKIADNIGYKDDVIVCTKYRDIDGNLSRVNVPIQPYNEKDIIIIDDICDGGATFINIVKKIKETEGVNCKIYLIVTHGIFSKGFDELENYFDGLYCTNSYKQHVPTHPHKYKLKQYNVF